MSDLNRRDFVTAAAGTLVAACAACIFCDSADAATAGAPTTGPTTGPATSASATGPVDVGTKADYAKDGTINPKFITAQKLIVIRDAGQIYACTAICSHRRATLKVQGTELICPSHGSHFTTMGTVTKGPAKASLIRYAIAEDEKGHLIVDRSKQFAEKDWTDPAASVKA